MSISCATSRALIVLSLFGASALGRVYGSSVAPRSPVELRELTTDRPDATESPFTVDAAHVQLELEAVSYTRDRRDGVRTTEWAVAPFNLRFGLTENFELGVLVTPFLQSTEKRRGGERSTVRGIGDTTLRAKVNLAGNDGGAKAFGVFADLKLPTAKDGLGSDELEGALTFPVAFELGAGWAAAAMTSFEFAFTGRDRPLVWVNTFSLGRELTQNVAGFLELTSAAGDGTHVATVNVGLTRRLGPSLQLDGGVNLSVSRAAPDLTVFAGLARKF
jgi:hypothetical protein